MQLIDTHVHLNFEAFQADLDDIAQQWREAGVIRLVHSCVEPSEFESIQAIANRFAEISFAVGLHPLDADKWTDTSPDEILRCAQADRRIVAIGEIGLDFFKADNKAHQVLVFEAQLAIAHQLNLPVIIHCRDAAEAMVEILQRRWQTGQSVRGVMHCWSGSPEETQAFLDLGFFISFSGIVTFKNAHTVHASAQMVPADRLLIETDCPFLAPVPHRGQRRNQPAYVRHVAERVAELRHVSVEAIAAQTTANACCLFNLSLPEIGSADLPLGFISRPS